MRKSSGEYEDVRSSGSANGYDRSGQDGSSEGSAAQDVNNSVSALGLKVVLFSPNERCCSELSSCLREAQCGEVVVRNSYPSLKTDLNSLIGDNCDIVIVELDSDPDHALGVVERIRSANSAMVMVCSSKPGTDLLMRCMHAGAREFLDLPLDREQVVDAMVRAAARTTTTRQPAAPEKSSNGKLLAFMGTKGGAGVTTLATNYAVALAEQTGARTLLLDLDLPLGDAALNLGLTPEYSTINALERIDRLDSNMLMQLLVRDSSGLYVLAAPGHYVSMQPSDEAITGLLELASRSFDYVVIDVGSRLDLRGTSLFRMASNIYLVTQVDVADLRNCNRLISQYFGGEYNNIEVVLSRYKRIGLTIDDKEIARLLSADVRWKIPSDEAAVSAMHNDGVPLIHGNNIVSKAIRQMVTAVAPKQGAGDPVAIKPAVEEPVSRKTKAAVKAKAKSDGGLLSIFSGQTDSEPSESEAEAASTSAQETRVYRGIVYVKGADGQWHAQGKADEEPAEQNYSQASAQSYTQNYPQQYAQNYSDYVEPEVSWNAPQPIDSGTALSEAQLNATANVEGTFEYKPAVGEVMPAGTHMLTVVFTPQSDPDNPVESSVQLTVNKLTPVIEWQKPESIFYGKPLGEEQLNAKADVPGSFVFNPPSGTVLSEGTHALSLIFIPEDLINYNTAVSVASISVSRMAPEITWSNPAPIFYGTRLDGAELNAKAQIPGKFIYSPAEGTMLPVGVHKLNVTFVPDQTEHYRESKSSVTLIVSRNTPEAFWKQPADIVYGTPLGPEHFLIEAKVPGAFEFSAEPGEVLCAGRHTLIAYFTPQDQDSYAETEYEATLTVAKSRPTLTWKNAAQIVYGTELSSNELNAEASVPGKIEYTPGLGEVLPVGQHTVTARLTPNDSINYESIEAQMFLGVEKAVPVVDWPQQLSITYGTPLGDHLFQVHTSVRGSYTLTPPKGEVLPAGAYRIHAVFTPDDAGNYHPVEADVTVQVSKALPAIAWESPRSIPYGTELSGAQLNAKANVSGHFTYTPTFGDVLGAGQHTVKAVFIPDDEGNYQRVQASVQLSVDKATPIIRWPEPEPIVYGEKLGERQLRAHASVPGVFTYTPAAGELLEAGTYKITASFTPQDDANFVSTQASMKLVVNKAVPTLEWPDPAPIEWGTPLSSAQLNAHANVPGNFAYAPGENERLKAGFHTLAVVFLPEDARNYAPVQTTASLTVNRATPLITWTPVSPVAYGTPLGPDQLNAKTAIPGVFVYSPADGVVLEAGTTRLAATFFPEDDANYAEADASASLQVEKAVPAIDWPTPEPIEYGTVLNEIQLNAKSTVQGTFTYVPPAGSLLSAGNHTPTVLFTPDSPNYMPTESTVSLVVKKSTPKIIWDAPEPIVSGSPLSVAQLNAKSSVPGKFAYFPRAGTVLQPGAHKIELTFVPTDAANYAPVQTSVELTVIEIKEVAIDWQPPAPIRYGTPLGSDQLCAKASVPGIFVYSPAEGTVLAAGTQTLMVTFIPDDDAKYAATQSSVSLVVESGEQAAAAAAAAPAAKRVIAPGTTINRVTVKPKAAPEPAPQSAKREIRVYKGATYVKEADGQWHLLK
jgi:Flp pilus assembly CpaE family ATPase